jgi:CubicO group peptidase (beta-lactamase class C family)
MLRARAWPCCSLVGPLSALMLLSTSARSQNLVARRLDQIVSRHIQVGSFSGTIMVVDRERIVYQRAIGFADREARTLNTVSTRFEIASMTKPMTAIAVMQLVEEGTVRLDGKVSDYLPWYPSESGRRITVEQLLNHTSGIQQDIAFDGQSLGADVVASINSDRLSNDSLVRLIARRPLRFEPGSTYGYSSDAYAVLGAIVEHVAKKPFWQQLRERVLLPAGMTETGTSVVTATAARRAVGYEQGYDGFSRAPHIGVSPAGGLYSTLRDLSAFDRALQGSSLVNERSKALLFAVRGAHTAYGWKARIDTLSTGAQRLVLRTTGSLPGFQALMIRVPGARRSIIILSNARTLVWRLDDMAIAIDRALDGRPYAMPRRSVAESLATLTLKRQASLTVARAFDRMRADTTRFSLIEADVNRLGYFILGRGALASAENIFALNARAFPTSANVYDSLGEVQLARGDTARAVASYRRSLELDPRNSNATTILGRIAPRR